MSADPITAAISPGKPRHRLEAGYAYLRHADEEEATWPPSHRAYPNALGERLACGCLLYRQATELHLKLLVGEGSRVLPEPTDPLSLYKTHSLRWLAQIVCQIIKAFGWEAEFQCHGIPDLAGFSALIAELEALEPVSCVVNSRMSRTPGELPSQLNPATVRNLLPKLDALLELLAATADGLAATFDLMESSPRGSRPTVH